MWREGEPTSMCSAQSNNASEREGAHMPDDVKIDRFRKALAESEFDVIVASSLVNTWYISEVVDTSQIVLPERLALVVWAKGKDPIHIVATNEEVQARKEGWIRDI